MSGGRGKGGDGDKPDDKQPRSTPPKIAFFDRSAPQSNPLRSQSSKVVNIDEEFKFKESDFMYALANLEGQLNVAGNKYIVRLQENYFHFLLAATEKSTATTAITTDTFDPMRARQSYLKGDSVGWKLHISVKPYEIEKAWEIICKVLMEHDVNDFKIIPPAKLHAALSKREVKPIQTKQISIYQFKNPSFDPKKWEEIIKQIEAELKANDIQPQSPPEIDKPIEGSSYFSYRNDAAPEKPREYIGDKEAKFEAEKRGVPAYNLRGEKDPFASVQLVTGSSPGKKQ